VQKLDESIEKNVSLISGEMNCATFLCSPVVGMATLNILNTLEKKKEDIELFLPEIGAFLD
jgi:hypothetical protein